MADRLRAFPAEVCRCLCRRNFLHQTGDDHPKTLRTAKPPGSMVKYISMEYYNMLIFYRY